MSAELTTIVIPDVPQLEFKNQHNHHHQQQLGSDYRPSNYGNFLSIPVFTFPAKDDRRHRPKTPTSHHNPVVVCPEIKISPAESYERVDSYVSSLVEDEGIECELDFIQRVCVHQ